MSSSSAIARMQRAVINYINRNALSAINQTQIGILRGDHVIIGRKKMRYDLVNDMAIFDGDQVCCLTPANNSAVIVGKL